MKPTKIWTTLAGIGAMAAAGYWYVFIAGAPQFDPPVVASLQQMEAEGLTFQLETFKSQALRTTRTYRVMLPL